MLVTTIAVTILISWLASEPLRKVIKDDHVIIMISEVEWYSCPNLMMDPPGNPSLDSHWLCRLSNTGLSQSRSQKCIALFLFAALLISWWSRVILHIESWVPKAKISLTYDTLFRNVFCTPSLPEKVALKEPMLSHRPLTMKYILYGPTSVTQFSTWPWCLTPSETEYTLLVRSQSQPGMRNSDCVSR